MAGDWIKMGKDLLTHPKVVRMSSALRADRLRTVGGLFAVWCLFDTHSADGQLSGYTPEALDELVGFPGISAAMEAVGWLSHDDEGVFLPRFEEHNGQSAKRRAQETDRKREGRKTSASDADKKRTREEKRREEVLVKEIPRVEAARPVVEQPPHAADDDLGQQKVYPVILANVSVGRVVWRKFFELIILFLAKVCLSCSVFVIAMQCCTFSMAFHA